MIYNSDTHSPVGVFFILFFRLYILRNSHTYSVKQKDKKFTYKKKER